MKLTRDIQSLSVFKRDTSKFLRQMKKTKEPIVLTVNGKAAMVIQDADSYQKEVEELARLAAENGVSVTHQDSLLIEKATGRTITKL